MTSHQRGREGGQGPARRRRPARTTRLTSAVRSRRPAGAPPGGPPIDQLLGRRSGPNCGAGTFRDKGTRRGTDLFGSRERVGFSTSHSARARERPAGSSRYRRSEDPLRSPRGRGACPRGPHVDPARFHHEYVHTRAANTPRPKARTAAYPHRDPMLVRHPDARPATHWSYRDPCSYRHRMPRTTPGFPPHRARIPRATTEYPHRHAIPSIATERPFR